MERVIDPVPATGEYVNTLIKIPLAVGPVMDADWDAMRRVHEVAKEVLLKTCGKQYSRTR